MWCIKEIDAEYRGCMYDVLDLYEKPYNPKRPQVCLDEKLKHLIGEKRKPIPMKPGSCEKVDYEYDRNGTANIFVALDFKEGKRITQVTNQRTMKDFALFVKKVVDEGFPDAEVIDLICDNLNTHKPKSFYEAFEKDEAERILNKIEFHYTWIFTFIIPVTFHFQIICSFFPSHEIFFPSSTHPSKIGALII